MSKVKSSNSYFQAGTFEVKDLASLTFFDLLGKNTVGTSNKQYIMELNINTTTNEAQIFYCYGPTGGKQTQYYEKFDNYQDAKKEFDKVLKSKLKKGYKEIDVAQRAYGSDAAKQITKAVELKNIETKPDAPKSTLHAETQRLISSLMGATNQFVITTLKCPLGQLTNRQIDEGRTRLNEAKTIVGKSKLSKTDEGRILELTNEFYSLIPHNLGSGARGKMTELLLDSSDKIVQKEYDLDTLLDAKDLNISFTGTTVDDQYRSLDTDFSYISHTDDIFLWLDKMIQETRASNHRYLGKISLLNAWKIDRKGERDRFTETAERIAKECGKQVYPDKMEKLVRNRPDGNPELYQKANVIPLFHGTRTENLTGIMKKGLLIRPSGAVITGSMFDNPNFGALYHSSRSSKSCGYCSINSSIWAKGKDSIAYLFLDDCALGNQTIAQRAYPYTLDKIKPNHSVWAKEGGAVINDEFMLYRSDQHNMKYLLEFTCESN